MPRLGFYVCPLTVEEFEQVYAMRALLDPAALRSAGLPGRASIARLKQLNHQLARTKDPLEAVRIDDRWHLELLSNCPNLIILGLIEQFMARTRRYELALFKATGALARSTAEHDAVVEAIEAGDLEAACAELQRNMESGQEPIIAWLSARQGEAQ